MDTGSIGTGTILTGLVVLFAITLIWKGVKIVPQSEEWVIERFGKFRSTLPAGLNFIIPFLDRVAHRVIILERQLDAFEISVISKDNVEVLLKTTVFFRVVDPARSVYRIREVNKALNTAATSIVRSAAGKLDLDDLQSSRESMTQNIATNMQSAAETWGIDITRTEITDIIVDEKTKDSQRQQLNAERERRAEVARAEGEKRATELRADAKLYEAQREAEAVKVQAEAEAHAILVTAQAEAKQTQMLAKAIADNGQPAIDYELRKRQVEALGAVASSENSKTIIMPTDIATMLGSLQVLAQTVTEKPS
jgi:regulator of protease activity HflC (stomatin/prohibitin superfamily)